MSTNPLIIETSTKVLNHSVINTVLNNAIFLVPKNCVNQGVPVLTTQPLPIPRTLVISTAVSMFYGSQKPITFRITSIA